MVKLLLELCSLNPLLVGWFIFMIIFIIVEIISVGMTSIWFAFGSLAALIIAACGGNFAVQLIAFFLVSFVLLGFTRPWAKKYMCSKLQNTNADSVVGSEIIITEEVNNLNQTGAAVVRGIHWTVRAVDDTAVFAKGEKVKVAGISGVKLMVDKINTEKSN